MNPFFNQNNSINKTYQTQSIFLESTHQKMTRASQIMMSSLLSKIFFNAFKTTQSLRQLFTILLFTITSAFSAFAGLPDLSVKTSIDNQSPSLGSDVIYTVVVKNINPDKATGVELTNTLPAGVTFKSFNTGNIGSATVATNAGVSTVVWTIGEIAGSSEVSLKIVATVNKRGFWYNIAEITKETQQDSDSTPNNNLLGEDDQDGVCFSIEEFFYNGEEYTTQLPAGLNNLVWTKKVGLNGTPVVVNSSTAGVELLANGNIKVTSISDYTEFAFTASNGTCPISGCCPVKFTPGQFGSIGSVVWTDLDGNGIRNSTESGLNNITVELYDATDNTLLATNVTANGGKYTFGNLVSGSYRVKFILPTGRQFVTKNASGSTSTTDSDAGTDGFTDIIPIDVTKASTDIGRNNLTIGAGILSNCIISAGTLTASTSSFCLPATGTAVVLTATTSTAPTVPSNFSVKYLLAKGSNFVIEQISDSRSFSVTSVGDYKIFTIVYSAVSGSENFLDLSTITFGTTTLSDLQAKIINQNLCAAIDGTGVSFGVKETLPAPVVIGPTVCSEGLVTLGNSTLTDVTFQWFTSKDATIPFSTSNTISLTPTTTTTYFVSVVSKTSGACASEKSSVTVSVNPKPATPIVKPTLANNCTINASTVNLADAIQSSPSTGGVFEWHTTNSTISPLVTNPSAAVAGTYFLFEKSINGCYSDPAIITVNINTCECTNPAGVTVSSLSPICANSGAVSLKATLSGGATSGTWTSEGTGTFDNANSLTAKYTPSAADITKGSIVLTFTTNDPDGTVTLCNAAIGKTTLTIKPQPSAPSVLQSDTLVCLGSSNKLFAISLGNTVKWYTSPTATNSVGNSQDLGFVVTPTVEGKYTYYAEATSTDGCVSNRTPIAFTVKKCLTDLAVVKNVITTPDAISAPNFILGQEISYTIDARNIGTSTSTDIKVTDLLPQGATFVSAFPIGEYNNTTGIWNVGDLIQGSNKILLINVKLTKTGSIVNTASIAGANDDPAKNTNNTSSVTVNVVERADLSLSKTVSNLIPNVGDTLTYNLVVRNNGPNTATNVEVKDILPTGLTFISGTDVTANAGTVTGTVASIANGGSKTFSFKAKVTAEGKISNAAEISKADQPDPNSTPNNGTNNTENDRSNIDITATEVCNLIAPTLATTNSTICSGTSTTITATGCTGSTIVWSNGASGVGSITVSPTTAQTFTAFCQKGNCKSTSSNAITINVTNIAAPTLTASPSTLCAGSSSILTATGCSGVVEWQTSAKPTGSTLSVTPTSTTTYTAKCKDLGCESTLGSVTVTVTQKPAAPSILASKTSICPSESVTLTALNCNGSVRWNTGQTTTSITVSPLVETTYSVSCTVNGCISDLSTPTSIKVTATPAPTITAKDSTICPGSSTILTATNCTGTVTWFFNTQTAVGSTLTVSPTATTSYTATCTGTACVSEKSAAVVVKVASPAAPVIATPDSTICTGTTITLTATGCSGTVTWSNNQKGASIQVSPTSSTTYSATCTVGTCTSPESNKLPITVSPFSPPLIAANRLIVCLGQSINLTATGCSGTVKWSDGGTGASRTITPTANIKYTATCESLPCISAKSNELSVVVNITANINAPVATNTTITEGQKADLTKLVSSSTPSGSTLVFKTGELPTSASVTTPTSVGAGTYYAFYQTSEGCHSAGVKIVVSNGTVADLAVQIDADRTTAAVDENINYFINITNNGPNTAKNIVITNTLPADIQFVSSSSGLVVSGGKIIINVDSLEKGQLKTFTYTAKSKVKTTIINPVSATASNDNNLTNNSDQAVVNGECKIGLLMSVVDTVKVSSGVYNIKYRLIAKNFCNDTLKNVTLTSSLAKTFLSPTTALIVSSPTGDKDNHLVMNTTFGVLDSNLVKTGSYMLPLAVDTITYTVQATLRGNPGPFSSQATITGKKNSGETLTAVSSDGTNFDASPSKTIISFNLPSTKIGLAKQVLSSGLKRTATNVWTVPYVIRVVNMGGTYIKKLSVRDTLELVFTKGATIVGKPTVTTTKAGITVNPNFTGSKANSNLLIDSLSTLAVNDSALINVTVTVNVSAATDSVFSNIAVGTGTGLDNKSFTDVSTSGIKPDPNGDNDPSEKTPTAVTLGKGNVVTSNASIGIALSAVTDDLPQSDGTYNVTLKLVTKNYGNVALKNVAISTDLEKAIGTQVKAWTILGRPTLVRGVSAALNSSFNGKRDTLLTTSASTALAVGDSIVITYIINVSEPLNDTLYVNANVRAYSDETSSVLVTDASVNGTNPDTNKDGKPTESSPTPIIFKEYVSNISIPHGFSPNGDGVNETFVIEGVLPDERVHLEVYNRWGSLVYESKDYKNEWDGSSNVGVKLLEAGAGLPSGTYFYSVTLYKRTTGEKVNLPPTVEPIRYMTISR